jgi:Ser/Thr protein kinase RdoA (MazF antagonist)
MMMLPEKYIATTTIDGVSHYIRLLSYVEGTVLSDFLHVGVEQLREVGRLAAIFDIIIKHIYSTYKAL